MNKETNYARGVKAEEFAADFLKGRKFDILETRYKTKFGEIDIIAKKGDILCFIEVKVRAKISDALEAVTRRAQKRIENSALFFLSENPDYMNYNMRFDVIALVKSSADNIDNNRFEITYLDNAWEATTIY